MSQTSVVSARGRTADRLARHPQGSRSSANQAWDGRSDQEGGCIGSCTGTAKTGEVLECLRGRERSARAREAAKGVDAAISSECGREEGARGRHRDLSGPGVTYRVVRFYDIGSGADGVAAKGSAQNKEAVAGSHDGRCTPTPGGHGGHNRPDIRAGVITLHAVEH